MRLQALIVVFLLFFAGCTNPTIQKHKTHSKKELINSANKKDIKAMIALNKYYSFPQTKEGLSYYKKWYALIDKNSNPSDVFAFSQIFYKYRRMFINGNEKYLKLLDSAKDKGNIDALLYAYYSNAYKFDKEKNLLKKIGNVVSKQKLENEYFKYKEKNYNTLSKQLKDIMIKKGFSYKKFDVDILNSSLYKARLDKNYFKALLASDDFVNIYSTANLFMSKTRIYKKEANLLYQKALNLTKNKIILGRIYERLAYYNLTTLKDKNKAIEYFSKGLNINDKNCAYALLSLLKSDPKYFKKYIQKKEILLQTFKGKKIYAKYLYKGFSESRRKSIKYFDELAKKGDKESIVILASQYLSTPNYNFSPEVFAICKKWQEYILNSNSFELFKKMSYKLTGYLNKDGKKFQKEFKNRKKHSTNILILEDNFNTYRLRNFFKASSFAKKAIYYGDKEASMLLAMLYLQKKKDQKAIQIYENLSQKGDIEATKKLAEYYKGYSFKPRNMKKAIKYYERLAKLKNQKALEILAFVYLDGYNNQKNKKYVNIPKAIKYLKILENQGDPYAIYYLGKAYSKEGKTKNIKKALFYYEKYFKSGDTKVAFDIAYLLYKNNKFDPNYKKALFYLKQASKYDDLPSPNYLLGLFYKKGLGVEKNLEKANYYFNRLLKANPFKVELLAELFLNNKDYENALFCFKISAKSKFGYRSNKELAILYKKGLGTKINITKALEYYKKAYQLDKTPSIAEEIAKIYQYGKNEIPKNIKFAKKWYRKSMSKKALTELKILRKERK